MYDDPAWLVYGWLALIGALVVAGFVIAFVILPRRGV